MKQIFVGLFLFSICLPHLFAADSSSGCGLGWMIMKKNSLVSSALRASTNATFLNTVGMTLGTSGCAQHSIVKNGAQKLHFTEANINQLIAEMAKGEGEYLESYAVLFGCSAPTFPQFAHTLKNNFDKIIPTSQQGAQKFLGKVHYYLKKNQQLKSCHNLI